MFFSFRMLGCDFCQSRLSQRSPVCHRGLKKWLKTFLQTQCENGALLCCFHACHRSIVVGGGCFLFAGCELRNSIHASSEFFRGSEFIRESDFFLGSELFLGSDFFWDSEFFRGSKIFSTATIKSIAADAAAVPWQNVLSRTRKRSMVRETNWRSGWKRFCMALERWVAFESTPMPHFLSLTKRKVTAQKLNQEHRSHLQHYAPNY